MDHLPAPSGPIEGELAVGDDGRVHDAPGWTGPPCVGEPVGSVVDPLHRDELERVRRLGWVGLDERPWVIAGRAVALKVRSSTAGVRIVAQDVTAWATVSEAREVRRRRTADAELAGGLARELTDPMAVVQGRLELLLELGVDDPASVRRHLEIAVGHARRVTATLRNLRSVGRTRSHHAETASLTTAAAEALDLVGPRSDRVLTRIEPSDLEVAAERVLLVRVMSSLVRLALETSGRTAIHLRGSRVKNRVLVRIGPIGRDTGQGLPAEIDLSLDRALLGNIGAELEAFPTAHGVSFDLWLALPSQKRARPLRRESRLWVVGSAPVQEAVASLLENDGFELVSLPDASSAMALPPSECDGVVSELLLEGGVSGLALARWWWSVRAGGPSTPFVLVTDPPVRSGGGAERILPARAWPGVELVVCPLSRTALVAALNRSGVADDGGRG